MREDSPPPFIVIRTPHRQPMPYECALELVGLIQKLLDHTKARFHIKDRLDRAITALVFELGKAQHEPARVRWRHHRKASDLANDCATILDILVHQNAAPLEDLEATRKLVRGLLAQLSRLG